MTMPIDLVLVRHGQSEGNAAKRLSEAGDHRAFTPEFLKRHTASFRLTDRGRAQAQRAGEMLREVFLDNGEGFDRYLVSEYARAMETAGLLGLPNAEWFCHFYLAERDWGDIDNLPEPERQARFGDAIARRENEPFFWSPPNGQSFADLCLRVDRVLATLHRECSDKRVIIVCHGEVMWAFRVLIERMSQVRFRELHMSKDQRHKIHNCQIVHYTRRNPHSRKLERYVNWMRMLRPASEPQWCGGWERIERPRYGNHDLLAVVSQIPAMVA